MRRVDDSVWCMRIIRIVFSCVVFLAYCGEAGSVANRRYSVEFHGADLRDVVRVLAYVAEKNIVIPEKINETVTVTFDDIKVDNAMDAILETYDLGAIEKGNTIRVATADRLKELGGDLRIVTMPLVYSKAEELVKQIESLLSSRGSVVVDRRTNAVTVRDSMFHIQNVRRLIQGLDIQERQVLLEANIVQASTDFFRGLGIQWGITNTGRDSATGLKKIGQADSGRNLNVNAPIAAPTSGVPTSGVALTLGLAKATNIDIQLGLAEERGELNVLSRPSIVTMNNQPATIRSGTKIYVKTTGDITIGSTAAGSSTTAASGGKNLKEIDAGITLTTTPQILRNDHIQLNIEVNESTPDWSNKVDGIPAINDNSAHTIVFLKDGETTVIGGLLKTEHAVDNEGIPFLSGIPILGYLFGSESIKRVKKELFIFIRPTIVKGRLTQLPAWTHEISKEREKREPANVDAIKNMDRHLRSPGYRIARP